MPAYGKGQAIWSVAPGTDQQIVSAETLGANVFSERVCLQDRWSGPRPCVLTFTYSIKPSAVKYDIYGAMIDNPPSTTSWIKIGSTTNVNGDQVTIPRDVAAGNQFRFVCVQEVTTPDNSGLSTVTVSQ